MDTLRALCCEKRVRPERCLCLTAHASGASLLEKHDFGSQEARSDLVTRIARCQTELPYARSGAHACSSSLWQCSTTRAKEQTREDDEAMMTSKENGKDSWTGLPCMLHIAHPPFKLLLLVLPPTVSLLQEQYEQLSPCQLHGRPKVPRCSSGGIYPTFLSF